MRGHLGIARIMPVLLLKCPFVVLYLAGSSYTEKGVVTTFGHKRTLSTCLNATFHPASPGINRAKPRHLQFRVQYLKETLEVWALGQFWVERDLPGALFSNFWGPVLGLSPHKAFDLGEDGSAVTELFGVLQNLYVLWRSYITENAAPMNWCI